MKLLEQVLILILLLIKKNDCSVYAENRRKKFKQLTQVEQLKRFGYWNMIKGKFFPNCYFYKKNDVYYYGGLIASLRILDLKEKKIVSSIGVAPGVYIELITKGVYYSSNYYGVKGRALLSDKDQNIYTAFIAKYY
tara:strand:- start:14 stop:421 length:408 start_codon:yes stop_codon:yes gene_type:complete